MSRAPPWASWPAASPRPSGWAPPSPRRDEAGVAIPPKERGRAKKRLMSLRALADLNAWLGGEQLQAAE